MINISGNIVDSPILKTDTITSDNTTITLEKPLSSSTEINLTAPSINLNGNVEIIGNINHNGSDIFTEIQTEIQTQIGNTSLKKILTQNITMQVGVGKQFTNLHQALVEANKYSVGYQNSNPTIQYRITIQIADDPYDVSILGNINDLYLPHVDIVCLGTMAIPILYSGDYGKFINCTFGSIDMSFAGGDSLSSLLTFVNCKIDSLELSLPESKLYIYNTNINTLHAPSLRTYLYSCTVYNCTGIEPILISTSNININGSVSTPSSFRIESSVVRIMGSSILTDSPNMITNSNVYIKASTISSSSGLLVLYSSNVYFLDGALSGKSTIIEAHRNSNVISDFCLLTNSYGNASAIKSYTGSKITIVTTTNKFILKPPTSTSAYVLCCNNAEIILTCTSNLIISNNGSDESIFVEDGGKISLVNVTGTTNIPVNTLTANGIIFSNSN